ncbi:MAG: hypothetical protein N2Z21_05365 [Candidatus Sumerlaeaceae bacterium]|nr:hypothetical protein [Candidatus Sumerlaeaceae bacterium]
MIQAFRNRLLGWCSSGRDMKQLSLPLQEDVFRLSSVWKDVFSCCRRTLARFSKTCVTAHRLHSSRGKEFVLLGADETDLVVIAQLEFWVPAVTRHGRREVMGRE